MKKVGLLILALMLSVIITVKPAEAAYLSNYDQEITVSYDEARYIADLMGLKDVPLGDETARLSFEMQEKLIIELEKKLNKNIDHYYIWLKVGDKRVLAIDPPVPMW